MNPTILRPALIVTVEPSSQAILTGVVTYCRLMPELLGRGLTHDEAVDNLSSRLTQALDAPDEFHRAIVRDALDAVRAHIAAGDDRL